MSNLLGKSLFFETLQAKVDEAAPWFKMTDEEKKRTEAEAKEKQGYNTGITYDQLARTPDDYLAEKVKFSGEVLQVMESDGYTAIRLAVNGDYDNVIYGQYESSTGLFTYESTMVGKSLSQV